MAAPRFADAVAKYDAARIALFGVPYDRTCSFRGGSRFAPRAIREASYNFETFMMDHQRDLLEVPVADLGDTPAFGPTAEMVGGVTKMASDIVGAGKIPIVIGGGHNPAPPGVPALPEGVGGSGVDPPPGLPEAPLGRPGAHALPARRADSGSDRGNRRGPRLRFLHPLLVGTGEKEATSPGRSRSRRARSLPLNRGVLGLRIPAVHAHRKRLERSGTGARPNP